MKNRLLRSGAVLPALTLAVVLTGTLAAWGGWSDDGEMATPVPPAAAAETPLVVAASPVDVGEGGIAAKEFAFEPAQVTMAAGAAEFKMTNEGAVLHTLVVDGVPGFGKLSAEHGEVATGKLTLPAGTYSFYCDQAGHRSAGMEGTLVIT